MTRIREEIITNLPKGLAKVKIFCLQRKHNLLLLLLLSFRTNYSLLMDDCFLAYPNKGGGGDVWLDCMQPFKGKELKLWERES